MRHLAAVAIVAPMLVSCAANQRSQYGHAQEAFITAAQACISLRQADKIDAQTYARDIDPQIQLGNRILDDWDAASLAGNATAVNVARSALIRVTDALTASAAKHKEAH